jgi:hypothetical protein
MARWDGVELRICRHLAQATSGLSSAPLHPFKASCRHAPAEAKRQDRAFKKDFAGVEGAPVLQQLWRSRAAGLLQQPAAPEGVDGGAWERFQSSLAQRLELDEQVRGREAAL